MNKIKYLLILCAVLLLTGFTACSDDDNGGSSSSQITVDKVYLENVDDTINNDREVTFARLGQLIRIQGSGFTGLKYIYVNGYETYFNNALMTDNNVWVTLNSKTPVFDADPDVRNTIQFVKDNGTYTYSFDIRSAAPSITSVDNTLPQAGETVTVYGTNLHETSSITLPGGVVVTEGITSDEDGEWYSFTMPNGVTEGGSITSVGANGTAKSPAYFNDNSCYIINFDGLGTLGSWSSTYSSDQLVDDPLNSGRGKCVMLVPQDVLDGENGGIKSGATSLYWATAGNGNDAEDWTRMTSKIPAATPITEIALQFDIYCPEEWNGTGQLQLSLENNLSNHGWGNISTGDDYPEYAYAWVPWMNEENGSTTAYTTGGRWQTVTIPLSEFGTLTKHEDYTLQDIIDIRNDANYKNFLFELVNKDIKFSDDLTLASSLFNLKVYIDNLRIVNCKSITVSDFDD